MRHAPRSVRPRERGQALVEFSLVIIPFLFILMGIVDLGRGVYTNNGVGEAARELARSALVHPCNTTAATCTLGTAPETAAVLATQKRLVPGLADPTATVTYTCTTVTDVTLSSVNCPSGAYVRVRVVVPFSLITPLLGSIAPATLSSTSHVQIP